jgi:hypothetical protein
VPDAQHGKALACWGSGTVFILLIDKEMIHMSNDNSETKKPLLSKRNLLLHNLENSIFRIDNVCDYIYTPK